MIIHTTDIEYCNPFSQGRVDFWMKIEHLGRYQYAKDRGIKIGARNILDCACADGYGSQELSAKGNKVVGIDISEAILMLAEENCIKRNIGNVSFVQCDLENEALSSKLGCKFDLIVSFETLEHLCNPERALREYAKLLSEDGLLILSVPNKSFEPVLVDGTPRNPYHKQLFERDSIEKLVESAGLQINKVLGQCYTNLFFNRQKDLIDDYKLDKNTVNEYYNYSEEAVRYFSRLFALPSEKDLEDSYSIIIEAALKK